MNNELKKIIFILNRSRATEKFESEIIHERHDESWRLAKKQSNFHREYHLIKKENPYYILLGEYPYKERCWNTILNILGPEIAEEMQKQLQDASAK